MWRRIEEAVPPDKRSRLVRAGAKQLAESAPARASEFLKLSGTDPATITALLQELSEQH
jgi:hypothetical protein